jgi:FkbM family methyltransferase
MKISNNINQYVFKNNQTQYVIYNYDYFTTDYNIPIEVVLSEISEYSRIRTLISNLDKNKTIIDIGANCGLLSIPCALDGYNIYAFEPLSMNVQLLERSKLENNCDTLTIIKSALLDTIDNREIFIPYCSDNSSFDKEVAISNMNSKDYISEIVNCITFDSWVSKNNINNIGFIKIDVQGYEQNVLMGMINFLNQCNDVSIFLEWDEKHTVAAGNSLDEINKILLDAGFKETDSYPNDKLFYKE